MAVAAFIISIVAAVAAIFAALYNKRSAVAAESSAVEAGRSADASNRSADAAEDSARHAEISAESARRVADTEEARDHDTYAPRIAGRWEFEDDNAGAGHRQLVYRFALPRNYRIEAVVWGMNKQGQTTPSVTSPSAPDGDWTVWVEQWTPDRKHSAWRSLELKFWPPPRQEGRATPWACRCGRPVAGSEVPHWDVEVQIDPPDPPLVFTSTVTRWR